MTHIDPFADVFDEVAHHPYFDMIKQNDYVTDTDMSYCDDCQSAMTIDGNEYVCNLCGFVRSGADQLEDKGATVSSAVTIISGDGRLQTFNTSGSSERSRTDAIESILLECQRIYAASNNNRMAIPRSVITAVAARYAEIQSQHASTGHGAFIRRGDVRKKVLAALIRDECDAQGRARKPEVIAQFMQLKSTGFSEGRSILQQLSTIGITNLADPCGHLAYAKSYCEKLGISEGQNVEFVTDIVSLSEYISLGMNSQLTSKVAGAIKLLIIAIGRTDITPEMIEKSTDNTKTNTYMKFYTLVAAHLDMFVNVFREYNIPYPRIALTRRARANKCNV